MVDFNEEKKLFPSNRHHPLLRSKLLLAMTPLGRIGQPDDIARVAFFLPPMIPHGSRAKD
jgi:NAD(P)-dependent dehydrogenase (short-subunit alcohol dehydrogenase family)